MADNRHASLDSIDGTWGPIWGAATNSANSAKSTSTLANSNITGGSDEEDSADKETHHWEVEE